MQPIDSIETYAYGMSKDLICMKEKIKRNNIIKQTRNNNPNWQEIPDHPYRILITGSSALEVLHYLI